MNDVTFGNTSLFLQQANLKIYIKYRHAWLTQGYNIARKSGASFGHAEAR
jgi:hypothetical protein